MAFAGGMIRRLTNRLGGVFVLALLGSAAVFFAMRMGAGDPAIAALGDFATPEAIAVFRTKWGLDQAVILQYWKWLLNALQGDFGASMTVAANLPIAKLIASRLPNTMFIGLYALTIAVLISLSAGTLSVLRHGKFADTVATSFAVLGISMPDFWLSYVLIYIFALGLGIFPSYGFVTPAESFSAALYSGLLPALAVAAPMAAAFTRILRTALLETLHREHVRVARSFGFREAFIFIHYVMRNALIPYVTVVGLQIRYILGGTVVVERIFGVPGIGALMVDAAFARDYPVVQACALTFLIGVLSVNFIVDLICAALNPRETT